MDTRQEHIEKEFSDWRVAASRRLLVKAVDEPSLRFPAVHAALRLEQNPLALLPSRRIEVLKEFFSNEPQGSYLRFQLLDVILQSPEYLTGPILRVLFSEIRRDDQLFVWALRNPAFPTLPGARDICLPQVGRARSTISKHVIEVAARHWPDAFTDFVEDFSRQLKSRNRNLRAAAARALGNLKWSEREESLRKLLQDPERIVRQAALASLVKIVGQEATPELLLMLKDSAPLVRIEACIQIAKLKEYSLLDALLERTADVSMRVRLDAFAAVATLDRGLALRNLKRFSRGGDVGSFLKYIQATKEEYDQFDERGRADFEADTFDGVLSEIKAGALSKVQRVIRSIKDVLAYNHFCDLETFLCLRYLLIGRLLVTAPLKASAILLEQESLEVQQHSKAPLLKFIHLAISNSLADRKLEPSEFRAQLVPYMEGDSRTALMAQALLIGILKGFDGVRHHLPIDLKTFRRKGAIDGAFTVIARFYWRILKFADWKSQEDSDWENDLPKAELLKMVAENLYLWSLFRGTPRCLGFLLSSRSVKSWKQIPENSCLLPRSLILIDTYRKFRTSGRVGEAVIRKYYSGELYETSAEIEFLAGMDNQLMGTILDYGQQGLFFKREG